MPEPLIGVWETPDRFVEFSQESQMRIVLKAYYGFVYEPFPWINCQLAEPSVKGDVPGVYTLQLRYAHEKKVQSLRVAVLEDSLYLDFMLRYPLEKNETIPESLDGIWIASGTGSSVRLYPHFDADTFFVLVFDGSSYYRVRYWQTDARERDRPALFTGNDGREFSLPKFIRIQGTLYTCITSTGTKLRNFEQGSFTVEENSLRFFPNTIIYSGTEAAYRQPTPFVLAGNVLVFGEPYLTRSSVTNLDGEIAAHNAKRRPPRKPIFNFMKLDFRWEEIERIRGGILAR
ncbi:MAG TPA: hypothetical protein GXZ47_03980 [Treponema sp.]|nr:hypothetical protein [Treponema sp.]